MMGLQACGDGTKQSQKMTKLEKDISIGSNSSEEAKLHSSFNTSQVCVPKKGSVSIQHQTICQSLHILWEPDSLGHTKNWCQCIISLLP